MSGRPRGAWSEKRFRDALYLAINEERPDGQHRLRVIANQLIEAAEGGDIAAIKEVADRLDGKPAQALEHTGDLTLSVAKSLALIRQREDQGDDAAG